MLPVTRAALCLVVLAHAGCEERAARSRPPDAAVDASLAADAAQDEGADAGHAVLTRYTPLDPGSECPAGGRRVDIGLDDGSGGAVADDGVLSPGEVDDSYADCDNDIPDPSDELEPPAGAPGSASIDLRGGSAQLGLEGGAGGVLRSEPAGGNPCLAEVTRIFPTGALPGAPAPTSELGTAPLHVTSDREVSAAELAGITGLHVAAGARLVLPAGSALTLTGDAWIEGTLAVAGGAGVTLALTARRLVLTGALDAAGEAAGDPGASVQLTGQTGVWLAGTLDVSGAAGSEQGGDGGTLTLTSVDASLHSSALLRADGGDGVARGGAAGTITLRIAGEQLGTPALRLTQAGSVSARGGAASGESGRGGAGGALVLSHCLPVQSVAELLGVQSVELGGGAASPDSGSGGAAGALALALTYGVGEARRLALHVPVRAVGGSGRSAGAGGALTVDFVGIGPAQGPIAHHEFPVLLHAWPSWVPAILLGSELLLDAGAGGEGGAPSGRAQLHAQGGLELRGALRARGGEVSGASGGPGGSVTMTASSEIAVSGEVDVAGAASATHAGGSGGCISLSAPRLDLQGMLSATGGDGEPDGSAGVVHGDGASCANP
jgi:hypothetical protein